MGGTWLDFGCSSLLVWRAHVRFQLRISVFIFNIAFLLIAGLLTIAIGIIVEDGFKTRGNIHHHHHLPDEEDIFEEGELDKDVVVSKMEITTQHGAIEGKNQKNISEDSGYATNILEFFHKCFIALCHLHIVFILHG